MTTVESTVSIRWRTSSVSGVGHYRVDLGRLWVADLPMNAARPAIFIGVLLIGLMELCFDSTSPSMLPAPFPTEVRCGALAIAYNVSISAVGGSIPRIAQALVSGTGKRHGAGPRSGRVPVACQHAAVAAQDFPFRLLAVPPEPDVEVGAAKPQVLQRQVGHPGGQGGIQV